MEQVEEWCAALVRREQFLRATGLEEWPDGTVAGRYGFVHGLYQQVLYDRLLVGRRSAAPAAWRTAGGGVWRARSRHAVALAVHFEGGREFWRAVRYRRQAADTALRRYAYREAVGHLTTALAFLQTLPETPERAQRELALQILLGLDGNRASSRAMHAPEVKQAFLGRRSYASRRGTLPSASRCWLGATHQRAVARRDRDGA